MSNLKMNCGYCGRKCSLDKDFCIPQDSVYICKSCYDWKQKVDDLEAKLEESEKAFDTICAKYEKKSEQIFEIIKRHEECSDAYSLLSKENDQLKQQLAEKDGEIEKLKIILSMQAVQVPKEQRVNLITANCVQYNPNQTAIAELEKLRNYLPNIALDISDMVSYRYLKKQIDQQINNLRSK